MPKRTRSRLLLPLLGSSGSWHRVVGAGGKIVFPPASSEFREQTALLETQPGD